MGREPVWDGVGLSEIGDERLVGVKGGRGEMGVDEEVMLSARTDEARRTIGGDGVRELSGSKVHCMIIYLKEKLFQNYTIIT